MSLNGLGSQHESQSWQRPVWEAEAANVDQSQQEPSQVDMVSASWSWQEPVKADGTA